MNFKETYYEWQSFIENEKASHVDSILSESVSIIINQNSTCLLNERSIIDDLRDDPVYGISRVLRVAIIYLILQNGGLDHINDLLDKMLPGPVSDSVAKIAKDAEKNGLSDKDLQRALQTAEDSIKNKKDNQTTDDVKNFINNDKLTKQFEVEGSKDNKGLTKLKSKVINFFNKGKKNNNDNKHGDNSHDKNNKNRSDSSNVFNKFMK